VRNRSGNRSAAATFKKNQQLGLKSDCQRTKSGDFPARIGLAIENKAFARSIPVIIWTGFSTPDRTSISSSWPSHPLPMIYSLTALKTNN